MIWYFVLARDLAMELEPPFPLILSMISHNNETLNAEVPDSQKIRSASLCMYVIRCSAACHSNNAQALRFTAPCSGRSINYN